MSYPHKLVFPAIVICLIVLAFNLLGDGLQRMHLTRSLGGKEDEYKFKRRIFAEVKDLHTSFFTESGEVKAVNGVSFTLKPGEVMELSGSPVPERV